jgi:pimeloyl-ACP methyl ester carboxylesterase
MQSSPALEAARRLPTRALNARDPQRAAPHWLDCAAKAYSALGLEPPVGNEAAALARWCTNEFLGIALSRESRRWSEGDERVGRAKFRIEFRGLSSDLRGPLRLTRAQDVSVSSLGGRRNAYRGFGVPLVAWTMRCNDSPRCKLMPTEGVYRSVTAWIEAGTDADQRSVLVVADPARTSSLVAGSRNYPLARDASAFYALGVSESALRRLGVYGLLGGDEIGRRAGLYLLDDYDPRKRSIIMMHGLAASPLNWARLSNAIWNDAELRDRFQVWHVAYQTNAPLLILRRRIQDYLDGAFALLDPEGDDAARSGVVLIGHSLGGVVARMLCVESGDVLWNAAFTVPPGQLPGDPDDAAGIDGVFRIHPYPGVTRAIFLAAPHQGSPAADAWFGQVFQTLVGRRAPEIQALSRLARAHPEAVRDDLRDAYREARLNSIHTLQVTHPVRRAGERLMPVHGVAYHTIAGSLPGENPPGDGIVPLTSAVIPGAASTLVVEHGHRLYESEDAIAEVLRILRDDVRSVAD